MRHKRLFITLFTAALVAGAVPIASAAAPDKAAAPSGCRLWAYDVKIGTFYRNHPRGGTPSVYQSQTRGTVILVRSKPLGRSHAEWAGGLSVVPKDGGGAWKTSQFDYRRSGLSYRGCR